MRIQKTTTLLICSTLLQINTLLAEHAVPSSGLRLQAATTGCISNTLDFESKTLEVSASPWLTATQGQVDLTCRMPSDWPHSNDQMLFHIQSRTHVHATLFFRGGGLLAVYKGGEEFFASIKTTDSGRWKPGSLHRIQFAWSPAKDEFSEVISNDVEFVLVTDGKLAGRGYGRLMQPWPEMCEIGGRHGKNRWQGGISNITLSPEPFRLSEVLPDLKEGERTITVDTDNTTGPCYRFWTVANCNGPHRFLKPGYAEGIKKSHPFITQINAVYLLGGRYPDQNAWYKGLTPDGKLKVDFSGMIAQLQAMLDNDFTPWIDLGNTPYAMSSEPTQNLYGNTEPPDDERIWARYVEAAVKAMTDAFGREQVESWWFRVGCEPDLYPGHWTGTKEEYFKHYDHTVAAVTKILPDVMIGPGNILKPREGQEGTSKHGLWGLDIIDHAGAGTNAVTGKTGTRMDWFSCSWYAAVGSPLSRFDESVRLMRERMAPYPRLRKTPLVIGEFTVISDESGRRLWAGDTTEWAASFYAGLADRVYNCNIRQVYEWAQTTGGVYHPRTQVIAMLDQMAGGQLLKTETEASSGAECNAISCRKGRDIYILLYNHRALRRPSVPESVHLKIRDKRMKRKQAWTLTESLIDAEHASWAYEYAADCRKAGIKKIPKAGRYEGSTHILYGEEGTELFKKNREKYRKLSQPEKTTRKVTVGRKHFECDITMKGHSVRMLKLSPPANMETDNNSSGWSLLDFLF
ncbi:MAG: hypothetical protein R6V06_03465 [Kiritimatiellia bacterium]